MTEVTNEHLMDEIKSLKTVISGRGGNGGMVRTVTNIESTVFGVEGVPDDRGLCGAFVDLNLQVNGNGRDGLKSDVRANTEYIEGEKSNQRKWNIGLSVGQVVTWIFTVFRAIG